MEDDTRFELDYIAAALALMCGRFTFPDGQPHPTAAARAFGHKEINHPEYVTNWIEKLKQLDAKIEQYGTMVRDVWTMSEPAAIAAHNEHMELRMAALELLYHPDGKYPARIRSISQEEIHAEMDKLYDQPGVLEEARKVAHLWPHCGGVPEQVYFAALGVNKARKEAEEFETYIRRKIDNKGRRENVRQRDRNRNK